MPVLLHLDSSANLADSRSRAVTATFAQAWAARGFDIVRRDLHLTPPPHLPDAALHWPEQLRQSAPAAAALAVQRELLDELLGADVVLIGAPMYNYSMPSTLKAWIDHIHVPGETAPLGEVPRPLAGKPAIIVSSRGGIYDAGTPDEHSDHVVPPLLIILESALGMSVETIYVSRTLAGFIPPLDGEQERAAQELADAHQRAAEIANAIGI